MYFYDETHAKKGADDVTSMLYDFFTTKVPENIKTLHLFCDGCGGQNKNWTMFRFLHYMVHKEQRFESIKLCFPVRGHSYLECDADMAHVPQSTRTEVPSDWEKAISLCRRNPLPYNVIKLPQADYKSFTEFLSQDYRKTSPMCSRPIREMKFEKDQPRFLMYRCTWSGCYLSADVFPKRRQKNRENVRSEEHTSELQ